MKLTAAFLGATATLALVAWYLLARTTPDAPPDADTTFVVVALSAGVVAVTSWVWKKAEGRRRHAKK